jgi:hypothetical protein
MLASLLVPSVSEAGPPPITGIVRCTVVANSSFNPPLNYQQGRLGRRVGANAKSKWILDAQLTDCTGTQTGGNPRIPGPIHHGRLLLKGKASGHQCQNVTDDGITVPRMRFWWYNAADRVMATTKTDPSVVRVQQLFDGSKYQSFDPPVLHPGYNPPGIILMSDDAHATTNSRAFSSEGVTLDLTADMALDEMPFICHSVPFSPGLTSGLFGFDFTGNHGPSTVLVG